MCVPFVRNMLQSSSRLSALRSRILCFTADVRLHPAVSQWMFNRDMMAHTKR